MIKKSRRIQAGWLDAGGDIVLHCPSVIGIFDIDNTTVSAKTREFLSKRESEAEIENLAPDIPVSFIVTDGKTYLSQYSPRAVKNRVIAAKK